MARFIFFVSTVMFCIVTVWYNYTTPEQRQRVPVPIQHAIVKVNEGITFIVTTTSHSVAPTVVEKAKALSAEMNAEPLTLGDEEGIVTVYEDLTGADLSTGRFDKTTFLGAQLDKANFSKAYMRGTLLDGASAQQALFGETVLTAASGRVADFQDAVFYRTDLTAATMQGANFNKAVFADSDLARAQFSAATFEGALFKDGQAIDSRFINARLDTARFERLDLRRASFEGASLRKTVFEDVPLHGVTLRNADLSGAILSSTTGLLQSQLHHACGDENTVLPKGLTITSCTEVTKEPGQKGNIAKGKYRQPPSPQKLAQQF